MRPNPVIDVHTHVVPERWDDWGVRHAVGPWPAIAHHDDGSASLVVGGKAVRALETGAFKVAARLQDMDRGGVDVHAISPPPLMFCYWAEAKAARAWARMQNENIAALCDTSGPPRRPGDAAHARSRARRRGAAMGA